MEKLDVKLVGFDLDGTLLDSFRESYRINKSIISRYGGNPNITEEEYRKALGEMDARGIEDLYAFYNNFGVKDRNLQDHAQKDYDFCFSQMHYGKDYVILGADFIVGYIRLPKFLVNRKRYLQEDNTDLIIRLDDIGLKKYFDPCGKYDMPYINNVMQSKKESINQVTLMHGLNPKQVAYVGDTVSDIRHAKQAGVNSIVIANEHSYCTREQLEKAEPTVILDSIKDLYKVIE